MFQVRHAALVLDLLRSDADNLTTLALNDKGLVHLGEITACYNLQTLSLQFNKLSGDDLPPVSKLWRLVSLDLRHNRIDHLDYLVPVDTAVRHSRPSSATTSPMHTPREPKKHGNYDNQLAQSRVPKSSVLQVSMWPLRVLRLSHNFIEDLAPLTLCQYVEELWIDNNRVADVRQLRHLAKMNNLEKLIFHPNPFSQGRKLSARFFLMAHVSVVNWLDGSSIDEFERAACKDWMHGRKSEDASQKMPQLDYAAFMAEVGQMHTSSSGSGKPKSRSPKKPKRKGGNTPSPKKGARKKSGNFSAPNSGVSVFEASLHDPLKSTVKRVQGSVFGKMSDSAHVDFKRTHKQSSSSSSPFSSAVAPDASIRGPTAASDAEMNVILANATRESHPYLFGGGSSLPRSARGGQSLSGSPLDALAQMLPDLGDLRRSLQAGNSRANLASTYSFGGRFVPRREQGGQAIARAEHEVDWNATMLLEPTYVKRKLPRMKSLPTIKHKTTGSLRVRRYPKPDYSRVRSKISSTLRQGPANNALASTHSVASSHSTSRSSTRSTSRAADSSSLSSSSFLSYTAPAGELHSSGHRKINAKAKRQPIQDQPQLRFVVIRDDGSVYCTWPDRAFAAMVDQDLQEGVWRVHANYDSQDAMLCVVDSASGIVNYHDGTTCIEFKAGSYGNLYADNGAKLLSWTGGSVTVLEELAQPLLKQAVITLRLDHQIAFRCNVEDGRFALLLSLEDEHVIITCSGVNRRSQVFRSQEAMMRAPVGLLGSSRRIKGNKDRQRTAVGLARVSEAPGRVDLGLDLDNVRGEDGQRLVDTPEPENGPVKKKSSGWKYTGPPRPSLRQPSQNELQAQAQERSRSGVRKREIAKARSVARRAIDKHGLNLSRSGCNIVTGMPVDRTVLMAQHDWNKTQYCGEHSVSSKLEQQVQGLEAGPMGI
jgi:hypothetical protein